MTALAIQIRPVAATFPGSCVATLAELEIGVLQARDFLRQDAPAVFG